MIIIIIHTLKAISKYSLTEAHLSNIYLDVPFLVSASVNDVFFVDIAMTINDYNQNTVSTKDLSARDVPPKIPVTQSQPPHTNESISRHKALSKISHQALSQKNSSSRIKNHSIIESRSKT